MKEDEAVKRLPDRTDEGWRLGSGLLPSPKDEISLWKVINGILVRSDKRVLVLAHHNADIDAVASALILKYAFPWLEIGAHEGISAPAKNLLSGLGEKMLVGPPVEEYSLVIVVDSSSPLQVSSGDLSKWPPFFVVDHHPDHDHWGGDLYVDDTLGACTEIALQMAMMSGTPLTERMTVSGLAGIIADTGKFRFAGSVDMGICDFLLSGSDVSMEDVMGLIEGDNYFDVSKKIAQLKAAKRVNYRKIGDQILASSWVSSFEAAAARSLLICGADVVFISANRKDELRISARAKPHIISSGIHLGRFMESIGEETGNQGGGHDGAAGLNGKGDPRKVLKLCMDRMEALLREKMEIR